jgi:hypothetical protein
MPDPRMDPVGSQYINSADVETTPTVTDLIEVYDATSTNQRKAISITNVLKPAVKGVASGYMLARGVHSTATASDTVVTGLTTVVACGATLQSDPVQDPCMVSATIGNQSGAPAAGSIYIKTWKHTSAGDCTPAAASTFTKSVNWWAVGT